MDERNRNAVNKDFIDLFLNFTEIEYTVVTPNLPQKGPESCKANDKDFLGDIFPFNRQYREHLFFISYDEKLEENTRKWFYIKLMIRQLWQLGIEQHHGDPNDLGYEFCFSVEPETHDIRIQDRRQLRGRIYKLKNQYRDGQIDGSIKIKLEEACSNIVQAIDNYDCLFGTAFKGTDQLDIAFGFLISDELMNDLLNKYPFRSESSCVTCIRIKKWPNIDGEERNNSKEITVEKEQDKYKTFVRDTDNIRHNSIGFNCDRTDVPDDSRKIYGSRSKVNDIGDERGKD